MGLKNNAKKIELLNGVLKELEHLRTTRTDYLNDTYDLTDPKKLSPSLLKESINNYIELSYTQNIVDDTEKEALTNKMKNLDNIIKGQTSALENIYTTLNLSLPEYTPTDNTSEKTSNTKKVLACGMILTLGATVLASDLNDTPSDIQQTINNIKEQIFENNSKKLLFDNFIWEYFASLYNPSEDEKEIDLPNEIPTNITTTEIKGNGTDIPQTTSHISIYDTITNTTTDLSISDFIEFLNEEAPFTKGLNKERIMQADIISDDSNIYKIILNGEYVIDDLDEPQKEKLKTIILRERMGVLGITEGNNINIYTDADNTILTPKNYNVRTLNLDKIYPDENLSESFTIYRIGTGGTPNIKLTTTDTKGLNNYINYLAEHKTDLEVTIDDNNYPDNRHHVLFTDINEGILEQNAGFYDLIGIINPNLTEEEKIDAIILMDEILTDLATSNGDGSTAETPSDDDNNGGGGRDGGDEY